MIANYIQNKLHFSVFYKIRTKIPQEVVIYFAFVHSQILYDIEVYANTNYQPGSDVLVHVAPSSVLRFY